MTPLHSAWTFDPVEFNTWLIARIVVDGELDWGKFRNLAHKIVADADDAAKGYLASLRCYPDLDDLEEAWFEYGVDEDPSENWYALTMAGHLVPAPSLDRRAIPPGQVVTEFERSLWLGDSLHRLAEEAPVRLPLFSYRPTRHLAGHLGGWLSVERAQELMDELEQGTFSDAPLMGFQDATLPDVPPARVRVEAIAASATTMLQHAISRKRALRLTWDA